MRNKRIPLLRVTLVLLPLLAACSSTPGPRPEPVTLTFFAVSSPWLVDQSGDYERLAEAFHEANPHITVQVKSISDEGLPQGLANADFLAAPEWGVDVVMASADLLPGLVERGLLRDLGPALEGDPALGGEDFFAPALDALRWQGHL